MERKGERQREKIDQSRIEMEGEGIEWNGMELNSERFRWPGLFHSREGKGERGKETRAFAPTFYFSIFLFFLCKGQREVLATLVHQESRHGHEARGRRRAHVRHWKRLVTVA